MYWEVNKIKERLTIMNVIILATDTWSEELPMMNARHGLGVASYDDNIYAIGGGVECGILYIWNK